MMNREKTLQLIYQAIDEVNQLLPVERRLQKAEDTVLFDKTGGQGLDSLGLINLMVAVEQKIADNLGEEISLVYHLTSVEDKNPLASIGIFADYVSIFLEQTSKKT